MSVSQLLPIDREPPARWQRTARDLTAGKWRQREVRLRAAAEQLEREVLDAVRDPAQSERESTHYERYADRLERCAAFGQYANAIPQREQSHAQHGLFGTAAALEILSGSRWANAVRNGTTFPQADEWRRRYLETVNFVDLVVTPQPDMPTSGLWAQRRITLRICHLLRALSSVHTLAPHLRISRDERETTRDMSAPLEALARNQITTLVDLLVTRCGALVGELEYAYATGNAATERSWRYAAGDRRGPMNVDEWIFLWGHVLVATARCARTRTVDEARFEQMCPLADFAHFREKLLHAPEQPSDADRRFTLFGLWALSHFDVETSGGPLQINPQTEGPHAADHVLDRDDTQRLARAISRTCEALLDEEVTLVDSWNPYMVALHPDGPDGDTEYRDDFMVVPTAPILLSLLARYQPRLLSFSPVLKLLHRAVDPQVRRDTGAARPYQAGARDGVVNLCYYQDAFYELARAMRRLGNKRFERARTTTKGVWQGVGRQITVVAAVLVVILTYAGVIASPGNLIVGLLFGIAASCVAAIAMPPVVKFVWGDSG